MPSLICTTKHMEVGWGGKGSSQLFLQVHVISHDAEGDRGNKRVWIPIPQCHPNPWGPTHNEAQILIITTFFFFKKSLERHRHSFPETLAPEGCSDSTPDVCLKSLSFCSQLRSCAGEWASCFVYTRSRYSSWYICSSDGIRLPLLLSPSPFLSFFDVACFSRSKVLSNM